MDIRLLAEIKKIDSLRVTLYHLEQMDHYEHITAMFVFCCYNTRDNKLIYQEEIIKLYSKNISIRNNDELIKDGENSRIRVLSSNGFIKDKHNDELDKVFKDKEAQTFNKAFSIPVLIKTGIFVRIREKRSRRGEQYNIFKRKNTFILESIE